jgi:hypothetical protein
MIDRQASVMRSEMREPQAALYAAGSKAGESPIRLDQELRSRPVKYGNVARNVALLVDPPRAPKPDIQYFSLNIQFAPENSKATNSDLVYTGSALSSGSRLV